MAERKTTAQKRKAAKLIAQGFKLKDALVAAGWSPKQAAKGRQAIGKELRGMIDEEFGKTFGHLVTLGSSSTLEEQMALVKGRLIENAVNGTDGGTQSAKLLGSQRGLDMFGPEERSGVIILQVSQPKTGSELPTIEGEIIPPKLLED